MTNNLKTHFADCTPTNESTSHKEWDEPLCGAHTEKVDNNWSVVDCKNCLKLQEQYELDKKMEMVYGCDDMAEFIKFMEEKDLNED